MSGVGPEMPDEVTIEIDGRTCLAVVGEMIIAVADREGIQIPRFCYHKKLSVAANCRMCLVEAEQGGRRFPKPVPACATPVGAGMKVWTRSSAALDAQRGTMEFLLINHPLDCPICDQGGECELQDVSLGYGDGVSRFSERKRVVVDEDFGPLIASDMTRCIHCTRCIRFGAEISGLRELGATGRGEDMRVGTYVEHFLGDELSGNVIDLCPVGALTSRPYRFTARSWELLSVEGIAPHDGVGANVHLHVRGSSVLRVVPRENDAVNECWISDRDRFSYEGAQSQDRLLSPVRRRGGMWEEVSWQEALEEVSSVLRSLAPEQLGCLVAPNSTLEEMYLLQKLVRASGSGNIDSRLRQQDFSGDPVDPSLPWLGLPIAELERLGAVLLVGCDIRSEQPLLAHRIRQAALKGAGVFVLNGYRIALKHTAEQIASASGAVAMDLAAVCKVLGVVGAGGAGAAIERAEPSPAHGRIAEALVSAATEDAGLVLLGAIAEADPQFAVIRELAWLIAEASGCRLGYLPSGANSVGAWLAGIVPHRLPGGASLERPGLSAKTMIDDPRQCYLLWGVEPDMDLSDPAGAAAALRRAQHVIACSAFRSPVLESVADLLLPIATFGETAGTFVNCEGRWQSFQGAVQPAGEARPGWKLLRVLGNMLDVEGFGYTSAKEIRDEIGLLASGVALDSEPKGTGHCLSPSSCIDQLYRVGNVPIYATDSLVRRAPALQRTLFSEALAVHLHPDEAAKRGLSQGDGLRVRQHSSAAGALSVHANLVIDDGVALGVARIPAAVAGSEALGPQVGPVELERI